MTTAKWTEGFSFISKPEGVKHPVGGQDISFLPVSAFTLLKLKGLVSPISECLAVLFDNRQGDSGSVQRTFENPDAEGGSGSEIIVEAVGEGTIKLRLDRREAAVKKLIEAVTEDSNLEALGEVILNSMRGSFPEGNAPPATEFIKAIPLPNLIEMLTGVAKANKGVFGPLAGKFDGTSKKIMEAIDARLDSTEPGNGEDRSETLKMHDQAGIPTPAPAPMTTPVGGN